MSNEKKEKVDETNIHEYIGQKFGHLTIINYIPREIKNGKKERLKVECICDCGKRCVKVFKEIRSGNTKGCGCRIDRNKEYYDSLIGKKFNHLTILEIVGSNKDKKKLARCLCDCGNEHITTIKSIKNGLTKSCGCLQKEIVGSRFVIDGRSHERLYTIYTNMKARCYNINSSSYKDYGKRGITICKEWLDDYNTFKKWSINNGYSEDLTIDRINVDGNYEPTNCRWVNLDVQANNKRNNHYITYNGKTQTLKQWCDEFNLNYRVVSSRFYRRCWENKSIEEKLFTPKHTPLTLTYNNETHTLKEWAKIIEEPYSKIRERYRRGYSVEDILCKGTIPRSHKPLQSANK